MSRKNKSSQSKANYPIGKQTIKREDKSEPEFYAKHKSTIWTVLILVILTIFFIMNNTRQVPAEGPYPPNYQQGNSENGALQ
jgi:uncharacterized integral membrane protein